MPFQHRRTNWLIYGCQIWLSFGNGHKSTQCEDKHFSIYDQINAVFFFLVSHLITNFPFVLCHAGTCIMYSKQTKSLDVKSESGGHQKIMFSFIIIFQFTRIHCQLIFKFKENNYNRKLRKQRSFTIFCFKLAKVFYFNVSINADCTMQCRQNNDILLLPCSCLFSV